MADRISQLLEVNGESVPFPSSFNPSFNQVNAADSGRTQDGTMHPNRICIKRKIGLTWNSVTPEVASQIMQAFSDETFSVRYWDVRDNCYETRTFYTGDMESPIKLWWVNKKLVESVSFDIIEI